MKNGAQFVEAMRVMFCMSFKTYMEIFEWNGIEYAKEKYAEFQKNPAKYITTLDSYNAGLLFNYLQGRVDTTPNSIKLIKELQTMEK